MRPLLFSAVLLGSCLAAPHAARTETIDSRQSVEICEASPRDVAIDSGVRAVRPGANLRVLIGQHRSVRPGARVSVGR